jgi:hypothetical protein
VWGKKDQRSESAEDLRGILNSGRSRGWPYVRWDPKSRQREDCPTFAMAIIGGIGDMPDTIEDRAVVIGVRRRAPGEQVSQWRTSRAVPQLRELRDRLHEWVRGCLDQLADADPDLPAEDRAADCWAPLVAIADAAGGDWPARARTACKALTAGLDDPDDGTAGERLLADLYTVWGDASHAPTATLRDRLHALDESPWGDWYGKPLTARALAKLLRPYGIKSKVIWVGSDTPRGYIRTDLADAWRRYATSATTQHDDGNPRIDGPNGRCTTVADADSVAATPSGPPKSWPPRPSVADVAHVAHERLESATDQDHVILVTLPERERTDGYCPRCGRDDESDGTCRDCDRAQTTTHRKHKA